MVSPDAKNIFTIGQDGSIFIYEVKEQLFNLKTNELRPSHIVDVDATDKKGGIKDLRVKIMDPDLADIVFVKVNQMEEWRSSQEQLRYQLALTRKKIEIKLMDQKKKFDRQFNEIEKQKQLDIMDLQKRLEDLSE
jgi:hypothetical protein